MRIDCIHGANSVCAEHSETVARAHNAATLVRDRLLALDGVNRIETHWCDDTPVLYVHLSDDSFETYERVIDAKWATLDEHPESPFVDLLIT